MITTLRLCREIIPICGAELNFRNLIGTTRAFPNIRSVLGMVNSIHMGCGNRFSRRAGLRTPLAQRNH
jgi:hypothetical protein